MKKEWRERERGGCEEGFEGIFDVWNGISHGVSFVVEIFRFSRWLVFLFRSAPGFFRFVRWYFCHARVRERMRE